MRLVTALILLVALPALVGCSSRPSTGDSTTAGVAAGSDAREVDSALFVDAAFVGEVTEETCTLSGGTETTCLRFSVNTDPVDHTAGPWCPDTIGDSAEEGGIWPESGVLYDVDGPFVAGLDVFYDDPAWKLYEDDGTVRVTDSAEACAAAARPNVDPEYQNHCVECQTSYLAPEATITYVIPKQPVLLASGTGRTSDPLGVAFNGISFAPPAPTDAILGAYTLAPFDDCGGHVNLNVGYHYHEAGGCGTQVGQADGHAPMIGYALDGIPFHALLDEGGEVPTELDECRGHSDDVRGYHYHVAEPGANQFVGCFRGEYGCALEGDGAGQTCDATQVRRRGPPDGGPPGGRPPRGQGDPFPAPHDHP